MAQEQVQRQGGGDGDDGGDGAAAAGQERREKLGEDVANELVEWFNQVDAAYRSEFRDLFEVHFARFEAKLEQRVVDFAAIGELPADNAATRSRSVSTPMTCSPASANATASGRPT